MGCNHERYGCRNNEFFCLICGEVIPNPNAAKAENVEKEPIKKPAAKRTKKGA